MLHIAGRPIFLISKYDSSVLLTSHYFQDEVQKFLSLFFKPSMIWTLPYLFPNGAISRLCTSLLPWAVQRSYTRPLKTTTIFSKWPTGTGIKRWGALPSSHEQLRNNMPCIQTNHQQLCPGATQSSSKTSP